MMGFTGLVSISENSNVIPDLAFFSILLKGEIITLSILIIFLAISLTISSVDTLINAISSLIIVDVKKILRSNRDYFKLSKQIIVALSFVVFYVASKGFSILYLFLLADLFCCAAVLSIFYSFYSKSFSEKTVYISIIVGLIGGILLFPSPDFSKSLLIGILLPASYFPEFLTQSLLFLSFIAATLLPVLAWKVK